MKQLRKPKSSPDKLNSAAKRREPLSSFARGLVREWRSLGLETAGGRLVVAVSGGADSVALMLALDELIRARKIRTELVVAHLNHRLRQAAAEDARWVESLAKRLGHQVVVRGADIKTRARKSHDNLEQAARRARYEFFGKVAKSNKSNLVVTGHTLNDQAETVVLNLIRGSGSDGLRGIEPVRPLVAGGEIALVRPLVSWATRADTESYCRRRSIEYREDTMNFDESFARVRVRRQLLPLVEQFNPRFIQGVARTAEILREDNIALDKAAMRLLELSANSPHQKRVPTSLRGDLLRTAPTALRRRALRFWLGQQRGNLRRLEHAHIIAIEKLLLSNKSGRAIELPGGATAFRRDGMLHYRPGQKSKMT
jgi:tRNA(Ile)-lysidine synthase